MSADLTYFYRHEKFIHTHIMSYEFHKDRNKYFELQRKNSEKYILPFIEQRKTVSADTRVLEVGCRDGGVLYPFLQKGAQITGVDLAEAMLNDAKKRYANAIAAEKAEFRHTDIHDYQPERQFDIIILKDVIEHVYGHDKLIKKLRSLMNDEGVIYFGYPPWMNPFGGHQQVAENQFISKFPYIHILPNFLYLGLLKLVKEKKYQFLKETKETRITIEKFRRLMKTNQMEITEEVMYLINPMYEAKFGLKPRRQAKWMAGMPWVRNFFTTTCDSLVRKQG